MKPVDLSPETAKATYLSMGWPTAMLAVGLGWLALLLLYFPDVRTIVHTWWTVGTYAHGLVVYPVSAWLVWRLRDTLAAQSPRPFVPAVLLLGVFSLIWLVGDLSNTQTLREFAFVASVPVLAWAVLGNDITRILLFPMAMTFFAWPVGEFFVPTMIDYTADFTVSALRLSGVPVYREGNFFVIPTGNWSVVEGCSGIRYLIASVYGGAIFAYLNFRNWKRRLPFMVAAVIVPIIANWLRAYIIVMLGHLSNNRIAAGVDHIIYGWIFFGIVIMGLFWIGSRFADVSDQERHAERLSLVPNVPRSAFAMAAVLAVALSALGPAVALVSAGAAPVHGGSVDWQPPSPPPGWTTQATALTEWAPRVETPVLSHTASFVKADRPVGMAIAYYRNQEANGKMLTYGSTALGDVGMKGWRTVERAVVDVDQGGKSLRVIERQVLSNGQNLVTWQWFWAGRRNTVGFWEGKVAEAKAKLSGVGDDAATVVLFAPFVDDPEQARSALRDFVRDAGPSIEASLNDAAER